MVIWHQIGGEWLNTALAGETFTLPLAQHAYPPQLRRVDRNWLLFAGSGADVRVNGMPLPGLIRVLADRDEIRAGGQRFYYSTESLAQIAPHQGTSVVCPRCKQAVKEGDLAVRCPSCGAVHHQSEEYPCWNYADHCCLCHQATAPTAGFQWSPEEL